MRRLKSCIVRSTTVDLDALGTLVNVFPAVRDVHKGVVDYHQEAEKANFSALRNSIGQLLKGGKRALKVN